MSRWGLQLEKSVSFRGATQPFSNTYYYEAAVANSPADNLGVIAYANDLIDAVLPLERAEHSNQVTYIMARVWSQIGTQAQNQMIVQRALSGTGGKTDSAASVDRERAILVRFRAGSDSRGRPVYLRKWWHLTVSAIAATSITAAQLQQTAQLATNQRTAMETFGNAIKAVTPGAGPVANLVSKNGRPIDGATVCHPYLEHHQLGEAWRGT